MSKRKSKTQEKEDYDPIIKRRNPNEKKNKETEEPQYVFEDMEEEKGEDEKLNFDRFVDLFKDKKKSKAAQKAFRKDEAKVRLAVRDSSSAYDPLKFNKREKLSVFQHFEYDYKELIKTKTDFVSEKTPEIQKNRLDKNFSYAFEDENEDMEVLNLEKNILNNDIKYREYKIKPSLKGKGKFYSDSLGDIWVSDANLESGVMKKGLQADLSLHPTIAARVAELSPDEDKELKINAFRIMESYVDYIYADANEEHLKSV